MTEMAKIVSLFMISLSVFSLSLYWSHILSALVMLEFVALSLFFFGAIHTDSVWNTPLLLMFLTIIVCSSVMSLSVMLTFARSEGTELFNNNNL
uniref:NADH dehydrogenase subunit 4L n=1 Tax=Portunion sp. TaxID=2932407 RepID=A0A977XUN3_9CRUS|nr:NADH dehydrogenase subunit 4L [Portunion sp.]